MRHILAFAVLLFDWVVVRWCAERKNENHL